MAADGGVRREGEVGWNEEYMRSARRKAIVTACGGCVLLPAGACGAARVCSKLLLSCCTAQVVTSVAAFALVFVEARVALAFAVLSNFVGALLSLEDIDTETETALAVDEEVEVEVEVDVDVEVDVEVGRSMRTALDSCWPSRSVLVDSESRDEGAAGAGLTFTGPAGTDISSTGSGVRIFSVGTTAKTGSGVHRFGWSASDWCAGMGGGCAPAP